MKYSKQRELVLAIVQNSMDHPTAESVYEEARKEMPNISLGTVYRNLKSLVENGKILQLKGFDEKDHYDKTLYDHGHMFCTECLKVYDMEDKWIQKYKTKVYEETGFVIKDYMVSIRGICKPCNEKKGKV